MKKEERAPFLKAVQEASVIASAASEAREDDGTCNFDTAILRMRRDRRMEAMAAEAGIPCEFVSYKRGYEMFHCGGQAAKRTVGQQTFSREMKARGYDCFVHYVMD